MSNLELKKLVCRVALEHIPFGCVIGVGSGSTVAEFIDVLSKIKNKIEAVVPASNVSKNLLKQFGFTNILSIEDMCDVCAYFDSADEFNSHKYLIKGGGGALTSEKILAAQSNKFFCLVDYTKRVNVLGINFPIAIEVLQIAKSFVAREIVKLGARPVLRQGFVTDHNNVILDVHNLNILDPAALELKLNNIPGVVENGIFAKNKPDVIFNATQNGDVEVISN